MYLGKSGMRESFAAAGSLVVLVAWVYYAAQIFLLGAEFTKVYADSHGSLAGVKAQQATEMAADVAEAGTSIVGTRPLAAAGRPAAATAQALDQAQRFRQGATAVFARQVIVLAIFVIANFAAKRSIQRQRKRLAASRKALRDA
jgi:membrane protein